MKFNFDYTKELYFDKPTFNNNRFDKWLRKLEIEDLLIAEFKGNNKEFIVGTKYNSVLPYYNNLSIWEDIYKNIIFTVHTKSETLETDLATFRANNPTYAIIQSPSWLKNNATCLTIRHKGIDCIGECKYFDNICPYLTCKYGLK